MNLFEGLEKFGLQAQKVENLFEEEKKTVTNADGSKEVVEEIPTEDAFLIEKGVRCVVCDKGFKAKMIKNGRVNVWSLIRTFARSSSILIRISMTYYLVQTVVTQL